VLVRELDLNEATAQAIAKEDTTPGGVRFTTQKLNLGVMGGRDEEDRSLKAFHGPPVLSHMTDPISSVVLA
jgi:hypothetical protein